MFADLYQNEKVLVTGHTGFKGSWLSAWLTRLGAKICGVSLPERTDPNHFDLLDLSGGMCRYTIPGRTEPGYFRDMSEAVKAVVLRSSRPLSSIWRLSLWSAYPTNSLRKHSRQI